MSRKLPSQPHLDHLKKQAKDLLADHQRGSEEAAARLRAALPSFAGVSDEQVARAPLALHDAQSAIAREHGFASWRELRAEVARRRAAALPQALVTSLLMGHPNAPLSAALTEAVKDAWPGDGGEATIELPAALPLVAVRNALLVPGSVVPLQIGRPASLAAIDAVAAQAKPTLALFSQRDARDEEPSAEALYAVGVQALLHRRVPDAEGRAWVVLRGLRWIRLEALEPVGAYLVARVAAMDVDDSDEAGEVPPLFEALRARARKLAAALPEPDAAVALVDSIDDPERLANLVVVNLPCTVDDKARYAAEPSLAPKLRIATSIADAALGAEP